ncbi:SDR family NAD(P)-dependent oxidoreductase [Leifsonia shinshuensis]|uniref:SDR family NAD(P)-dependent oxidoreductase n=1 Tax=Leifsonia shinshuensis TaxID=150026 RepID=UPI00285E3483|nr:SDR family NAD(P)-dependent oxidoreductase [Leifsonia shinshuensis]MDR6971584.1 NAD(P)-dependent dehydrogenase (short-subunit alcohol dehydrogenase family) [Leifsonia shinshuensis]
MTSPVLLITGTSSGIGLESAVAAARHGFRVVATMRDLDKAEPLRAAAGEAGVDLDLQRLDVTDERSVADCIGYIREAYGRLDALLNNAGAGHVGTIELETIDDVRSVMEVNFFGVVSLTRAALPLLRESRGRVVTVSSVGGVVGQPFNEAYCAAKFAVEGFMESLTPVAATVGVRVTVVEPGAVSTEFVANVGLDANHPAYGTPYEPAFSAYLARTAGAFDPSVAQAPEGVAGVILGVLDAEQPPARIQTSENAVRFAGIKLSDLDGSHVQAVTAHWMQG